MKKFIKAIAAVLLAVALTGLTACDFIKDLVGGTTSKEEVYSVTLTVNDGTLPENANVKSYTAGTEVTLPVPVRENYDFVGWYQTENYSDDAVSKISSSDTGNKIYYARWSPKHYSITLNLVGGTLSNQPTEYIYGEGLSSLPAPAKDHYSFTGWYDSQTDGNAVTSISTTDSGDKVLWAHWGTISHKLTLNLDGGELPASVTSYTEGVETTLPVPTKDNYEFMGWYTSSNKTGTAVMKITATDKGDKTFYAKWEKSSALKISSSGGYEEGAYVEFSLVDGVSKYEVTYKLKTASSYSKAIDSELVRGIDPNGDGTTDKMRADIVGIAAGEYTVKVTAGNINKTCDVTVKAYDRSGYAHFDSSSSNKIYKDGVGGYNNDGTPKTNAQIVYFNKDNKNDNVKINNKTYKGIVGVLSNAKDFKDGLIVRIVGTIGAATWKEGNVTYTKTTSNTTDGKITGNLKASVIKGKNGLQLPQEASKLTQDYLKDNGYNELDTSKWSILEGLSSKASVKIDSKDSEKTAYDSCWNDCPISSAKNVTVEGIGTDAKIFQWGMTWKNSNSIEVRNIIFDDYTEDACSFEGNDSPTTVSGFASTRFWVHNNTFNQGINYWDVSDEQDKHEGDGATDFKRLAYVTISYNHYYLNHKTGLIGSDDNVTTANVTFHHNYYQQNASRMPLARQANMHMYNNYYSGSTGDNMSIRSGGYAFIEYCYFDNMSQKVPIQTQLGKTDKLLSGDTSPRNGYVKLFNCTFKNCKDFDSTKYTGSDYNITLVTDRTTKVSNQNVFNQNFDTDASAFYYDSTNKRSNVTDLITDTSTLPAIIPQLAGVHKN